VKLPDFVPSDGTFFMHAFLDVLNLKKGKLKNCYGGKVLKIAKN